MGEPQELQQSSDAGDRAARLAQQRLTAEEALRRAADEQLLQVCAPRCSAGNAFGG